MLAVKFQDKQVVLEDVPPPSGEGVIVDVRACGICGSDVTILDSGFPITGTPGHEISGLLEDGTPVAIEPIAPCGDCRFCLTGDTQVCTRGNDMVYGVGQDGGMAEQILVPERCLVPLPRSVDPSSVRRCTPSSQAWVQRWAAVARCSACRASASRPCER